MAKKNKNNNVKINQEIVTEDKINKNSTMFDFDEGDTTANLPNAEELLEQITKVLEFCSQEEMINLKKENQNVFEEIVEAKFQDFANRYYGVFKMLLTGLSLEPLFEMIRAIDNVNKGKQSLEKAEKNVGKYLGKFLPDHLRANLEDNLKD